MSISRRNGGAGFLKFVTLKRRKLTLLINRPTATEQCEKGAEGLAMGIGPAGQLRIEWVSGTAEDWVGQWDSWGLSGPVGQMRTEWDGGTDEDWVGQWDSWGLSGPVGKLRTEWASGTDEDWVGQWDSWGLSESVGQRRAVGRRSSWWLWVSGIIDYNKSVGQLMTMGQ